MSQSQGALTRYLLVMARPGSVRPRGKRNGVRSKNLVLPYITEQNTKLFIPFCH